MYTTADTKRGVRDDFYDSNVRKNPANSMPAGWYRSPLTPETGVQTSEGLKNFIKGSQIVTPPEIFVFAELKRWSGLLVVNFRWTEFPRLAGLAQDHGCIFPLIPPQYDGCCPQSWDMRAGADYPDPRYSGLGYCVGQ
jgi:hypothetical protein